MMDTETATRTFRKTTFRKTTRKTVPKDDPRVGAKGGPKDDPKGDKTPKAWIPGDGPRHRLPTSTAGQTRIQTPDTSPTHI